MLLTLASFIMIELEISVPGECDLDKSPQPADQFVGAPGAVCEADRKHERAWLEIDQAAITLRETPYDYFKQGLEQRSSPQLLSS